MTAPMPEWESPGELRVQRDRARDVAVGLESECAAVTDEVQRLRAAADRAVSLLGDVETVDPDDRTRAAAAVEALCEALDVLRAAREA